MRHCYNADVEVYETHGADLSALLGEAAGLAAVEKNAYVEIHTTHVLDGTDGYYVLTAYVHKG